MVFPGITNAADTWLTIALILAVSLSLWGNLGARLKRRFAYDRSDYHRARGGIHFAPSHPHRESLMSADQAKMCGRGGIGRRAALRSLFLNRSGSSSLLDRTITPSAKIIRLPSPKKLGQTFPSPINDLACSPLSACRERVATG